MSLEHITYGSPWVKAMLWRELAKRWRDVWTIPDDPLDLSPWTPLFTEVATPPWVSPGRISLAPALSYADQMTWDAASFMAVHPEMRLTPLWVNDALWGYMRATTYGADLDSIRKARFTSYASGIVDPALILKVPGVS